MTDPKTLDRAIAPDAPDAPGTPPERKKLVEMSATQLVGGALAAMTSAVIGARLGVAGTVIGAAIGSLVAGVAGSLYTASLKHTKDKIASAIVGKVGDTPVELTTLPDDTLVSDRTKVLGRTGADDWHWDTTDEPAAAVAPASPDPVAAEVVVDDQGHTVRRWPWKAILVSTAAVFLLAIAGLTGYELISGQSVSGGDGTTIGQVSEGRSGGSQTKPEQAPSSTPSSEPSTASSSEPSASSEPSSSASSQPSSEPSASSEPTESGEPSANNEPSSSSTPSTAAGAGEDQGADGDSQVVAGG